MKYFIILMVTLVIISQVAFSNEPTDTFKSVTDEFTGVTTYYPAHYSICGAFESANPSVCVAYQLQTTHLIIRLQIENKDWVFAKNIFMITDDGSYTIPYDYFDIVTKVITDPGEVRCQEVYLIGGWNMPGRLLDSITSSQSIRLRIGFEHEILVDDLELSDIKDSISLFRRLGGVVNTATNIAESTSQEIH